jgi:hypothetical protein
VTVPALALAERGGSPGVIVTSVVNKLDPNCGYQTSQTFRAFGDPAYYFLAPGGNAESNRWTTAGGAGVTAGQGVLASGLAAYDLPRGSSITSSAFCINLDGPTVRFSVKDPGVPGGVLRMDAIWTAPTGTTLTVPIATVPSTTKGVRLVAPSLVLFNLGALIHPTKGTTLKLQVTAIQGAWQVDDVYVDPYKRV